ncbi:ATP-binding protein [Phaeobacter sp. CNT1-3]|nr:ATP-binding protein [Phaeobacter sp. CNT1-3]
MPIEPHTDSIETPPKRGIARLWGAVSKRFARAHAPFTGQQFSDEELYAVHPTSTQRVIGNPRLLALLSVVGFIVMTTLTMQVVRDVRLLRQSTIEDIEWSLSKAEVEFLSYQYALRQAAHRRVDNFVTLRREFDILQNRIEDLRFGVIYEPLRDVPGFNTALDSVSQHLGASAPALRSVDATLARSLIEVEEHALAMTPHVRAMAAAGQTNLEILFDRHQMALSTTLQVMGAVGFILTASLGLLAFYFNQLRQQSDARRRSLITAGERTRAVMASSLDAVIVCDPEGVIEEFNAAAEEIFGHRREDAIGANVADLIVPAEQREAHVRGMRRVSRGGGFHMVGKGRVRMEARRADDTMFPIEMALQKSESHGHMMYIAFVRDISYRVRAERDLIEARDQARAGEKAKSRFLAVMSHEIRTPMNGILGNMSLLRETKLSPEQEGYLAHMESSSDILLGHVNDVLDIARCEDGKPVVQYRPTRLRDIIDSAVESMRPPAEDNGNSLTLIHSGPDLGWVQTDPGRVQQMLLNLLSNAAKFTENGSIIVDVRCKAQEDDITIHIKDDGIGIAEPDLDRVFEDFFTQDDSFARKTEGTGLGLGIVRRISEALGGSVSVTSKLGIGTTFTLRLPMPRCAAPEDVTPPEPKVSDAMEQNTTDMLRILVVEDNQINRDVVRAMLTREGHLVEEAHNGQSGVEKASEKEFDLILMDISMPVLDGREATRAIRDGEGASANSPIIALTAHVMPENVTEFLGLGMQDVLPKPLLRPDLQRIIRDHAAAANNDTCPTTVRMNQMRQLVDMEVNKALRESVGEAYDMLLGQMSEELQDLLEWLQAAEQPLSEVADRCHKFASSAAVFGALPLQKLLVGIELAAKSRDTVEVERRLAQLPEMLATSLNHLQGGGMGHNQGRKRG